MKLPNKTEVRSAVCHLLICSAICLLPSAIAVSVAVAADAVSLTDREQAAFTAAAEKVAPAVVQIRTIGGLDIVEGTPLADGPTTGLIISPDGFILSSAFNFAQRPASILLTFASGKQAPAELVATDHSRMLVLLKATGVAELPVAENAPVDEIRVGQWAVAVGRTFRADRTNMTVGIVSAVGRMFGRALQTDADVSTTNYGGPLVDLRGRVLGLIVPMAPQATSEVAGVEWYDSGIGFAVPLATLAGPIDRMKQGEDLRAGLLGIGLQPASPHSSPAELAVVRPDSPAAKSGLKKGDRIVEVDGKPIRTQTDLRFALGTAYGGDTVRVVATRGPERLERSVTLSGELAAFRHAFLGMLPMRPEAKVAPPANNAAPPRDEQSAEPPINGDGSKTEKIAPPPTSPTDSVKASSAGVVVRMVYLDSPAAAASVLPGDRIVQINDVNVATVDDAIQAVNNLSAESQVPIQLIRDGKSLSLTLTATALPTIVPSELPPASKPLPVDALNPIPAGVSSDLKLPEFAHSCRVYLPSTAAKGRSLGVLLWLQPPDSKPDDTIRSWQSICDRDGLILVLPTPKGSDHWERIDLEYLHRLLERVIAQHRIDRNRVVVGGQGNVGAIAWPLAFASRDLVHGVATVAAPLPRPMRVPANDPTRRLAVFAAIPPKKDIAATLSQKLKEVSDAGYNVATITTIAMPQQLADSEREELSRWIDTLDRF